MTERPASGSSSELCTLLQSSHVDWNTFCQHYRIGVFIYESDKELLDLQFFCSLVDAKISILCDEFIDSVCSKSLQMLS